jgi:multidrug efflux pump subunit AcrA (membrane-fusion protein)
LKPQDIITIAGEFPNTSNLLRPGQFAKVRALTSVQQNAVLFPRLRLRPEYIRTSNTSSRNRILTAIDRKAPYGSCIAL